MKYLLINDDGLMRQSNEEPDEADLECIVDGSLYCIIFEDGKFLACEAEEIEAESEDEDSTYEITRWVEVGK